MFYPSTQYLSSKPSFLCDSAPVVAMACMSSYHLLNIPTPSNGDADLNQNASLYHPPTASIVRLLTLQLEQPKLTTLQVLHSRFSLLFQV